MAFTKMFVFFLLLAVSGVLSVPTPDAARDARSPDKDLETSETFLLGGYGLGLGYGLYGGWGYPWGGYGGWGYPYGYGGLLYG